MPHEMRKEQCVCASLTTAFECGLKSQNVSVDPTIAEKDRKT